MVGPVEDNEQEPVTLVWEKVQSLGHVVASGADTLLGIYEATEKDVPLVVGLHYLDPIRIPVLTSDDPVQSRPALMLKTAL